MLHRQRKTFLPLPHPFFAVAYTLLVKNRPAAYLLWVLKRKLKPASPVNSKVSKDFVLCSLRLIYLIRDEK
jgi:hypothetical protein